MKQFTITYRSVQGFGKFAFVEAADSRAAQAEVRTLSPGATILTVRENNPPLAVIRAKDN